MKTDWDLTQNAFDHLLAWLDADRILAGNKYEAIRGRLIRIFTCRGCFEAEDLADETINRVTAKVEAIANTYKGDPALYFYGVAQKVHLEYLRKTQARKTVTFRDGATDNRNPGGATSNDETEYQCLERCLGNLPSENRRLVLEYYQQERHAKIEHRKRLAEELGIAVNALRIRAHRIRLILQNCVQDCLQQQPVS